jgi:hypothetical protein
VQRLNPTPDASTKLLSNSILSHGHLINRLLDLPLESLLLLDKLSEVLKMRPLS